MRRIVLLSFVFLIGASNATFAQQNTKHKSITTKKTNSSVETSITSIPKDTSRLVEITTNYGVMIARLYDNTPLHRDNFLKLTQAKFFDSLLFHRVINGFMIQGGDPNSRHADSTAMLGNGEAPGGRIPAEFRVNHIHKKGALAAARDENPEKASSNCQFYIVQGRKTDANQLKPVEENIQKSNPNFKYTEAQKEIYNRIGGTPHLDQNYTVFGEVITGLEVIDKIAAAQTRQGDRPVKDVWMKMKVLN